VKVVPDYLEGYLDLERFLFLVLLLLVAWGAYRTYSFQQERIKVENQSRSFATQLPSYQKLHRDVLRNRSPSMNQNIENNPLSYLERVVPERYLTDLEPIDQGSDDYRFELRVESTDLRTILSLLRDFESKSQLTVNEFTLIRESLNSSSFHAIIRLEIVV
jgi:hypothetical protein